LSAFFEAVTRVFSIEYAFFDDAGKVEFLLNHLGPDAKQWVASWKPTVSTTSREYLDNIWNEHYPQDDEKQARAELGKLRLSKEGTMNDLVAAIDLLRTRLGRIDDFSLLERFYASVGSEWQQELERHLLGNRRATYDDAKVIARQLYHETSWKPATPSTTAKVAVKVIETPSGEGKTVRACYYCNDKNHMQYQCLIFKADVAMVTEASKKQVKRSKVQVKKVSKPVL
jgi:hypothetical protein